jgi:hypothetical protein
VEQLGQTRFKREAIFNFVVEYDDSNDVGFLKSFYSAGILYVTTVNVVSHPVKEYNNST